MSYISTNHRGGIGNVMFKLAASISTAIDNNVDYLFSNEFIATTHLLLAFYLMGIRGEIDWNRESEVLYFSEEFKDFFNIN